MIIAASIILSIALLVVAIKFPKVGEAIAYAFDQFIKGLTKTK